MAVGEEAILLPTRSRCSSGGQATLGQGYHATSQRARRVAIGALMLLMTCALVGTLSHVSVGARFYGLQAAHKRAAATQQLYEYYEQLLDQTTEYPEEKPAVRSADPLQITQLDEEADQAGSYDSRFNSAWSAKSAAQKKEEVPTSTQQLDEEQTRARRADPGTHGITDGHFAVPTDELENDNRAHESALRSEIERLSAEEELSSSEPKRQQLATELEDEEIVEDEDEKKLKMHRQSLQVLQRMLEQTKAAAKKTKHRLMIKAIAKEVMAQIKKRQDESLAIAPDSVTTEQLYSTNEAQRQDLAAEISRLSAPRTQELLQIPPPRGLQAPTTRGAHPSKRVLKTADGAPFQTLADDKERIEVYPRAHGFWEGQPKHVKAADAHALAGTAPREQLLQTQLWRPSDLTRGLSKGGIVPGSGSHVGSMASWQSMKTADGAQFQALSDDQDENLRQVSLAEGVKVASIIKKGSEAQAGSDPLQHDWSAARQKARAGMGWKAPESAEDEKVTADGARFQTLDEEEDVDPWQPNHQGSEDKNTK